MNCERKDCDLKKQIWPLLLESSGQWSGAALLWAPSLTPLKWGENSILPRFPKFLGHIWQAWNRLRRGSLGHFHISTAQRVSLDLNRLHGKSWPQICATTSCPHMVYFNKGVQHWRATYVSNDLCSCHLCVQRPGWSPIYVWAKTLCSKYWGRWKTSQQGEMVHTFYSHYQPKQVM